MSEPADGRAPHPPERHGPWRTAHERLRDRGEVLAVDGRRVRVGRVITDKAHAHPGARTALRRRRIKAAIRERVARIARKTQGSAGGRPPAFDPGLYKPHTWSSAASTASSGSAARPPGSRDEPPAHRAEIILARITLHPR
ncbi:hypothetical protein [Actinosynnema pretiosum]|uniref:hypothetical protein n=1 Tax=Actinosynnema pretiosum TaxID=42197 RepID=UPI000B1FCCB4|nr:hypothetical protein [Actinosynnema pretiosum]